MLNLQKTSSYPIEVLEIIDAFFSWKTKTELKEGLDKINHSPLLSRYFRDRDNARTLAEEMAGTELPQRAYRVLVVANKLGCYFKPNHYESVVHRLASSKQWAFIPLLVSLGKKQCGRTSARLMDWRTRAFVESFQYAQLENILKDYENENIKPTSRTYHLLISGHLRNHNLVLAKQCMQSMIEAGHHVDASTHSVIVSVYRSLGPNIDVQTQALDVLHELDRQAATIILNSVIQQRLDVQDLDGAIRYVKRFYQLSPLSADTQTQSPVVAGENPSVQIPPPTPPHSTSSSPSCYPDATTFSILIKHMAQRHDLAGALQMLEHMVSAHIKPDPGTVATLVQVYCATDHHDYATTMVAKLCKSHDISIFLFSLLGLRCTSTLPINITEVPATVEIFNSLMHSLLRYRGLNGARIVLRVMRVNGIRPNESTIEVLMNYLDKVEHARPRELVRVLRHLSYASIQPTLRHVHIILRSILRREKFLLQGSGWNVTAAKLSSRRQDKSHYPTGRISDSLLDFDPLAGIQVPRHLRYHSLLRPLLLSLSRRRIRGDRATFALRMKHEAVSKTDLETAKEVFRFMVARGLRPNEYHYAALMEGYAQQGDLESAEDVMHSAAQAGVRPNVVMYTILIVGLARQGKPELAMRMFQSMISAAIRPDVPSIDAVTSAYFAVGAYRLARQLLVELWSHIRPFPKELRRVPLKELARIFRSYHETSSDESLKTLTKQQQRMLRWKLQRLERIYCIVAIIVNGLMYTSNIISFN
ncbi:hypothetical protein SERLA73DRAFT_126856 [Serpula lacrymans var. lacrymans S7.3]|uniref:Pentacotripeptide-repeat region of PRORP domain-containing protein n=1 Tax=Serpula lacrymans var. lacrymans (strain S7.3) TaxID=936435 RepID=F8QEV9_SERL3|nr:hypothetical protein SERLA73DRAFT_126856 [Serpula lacrymans var. lacrymans S7.3]